MKPCCALKQRKSHSLIFRPLLSSEVKYPPEDTQSHGRSLALLSGLYLWAFIANGSGPYIVLACVSLFEESCELARVEKLNGRGRNESSAFGLMAAIA